MSIIRTATLAFTVGAIALPAFAADMNDPIIAPPPVFNPGSTPVEYGSGWYLRGDVGYGDSGISNVEYRTTGTAIDSNFVEEELFDTWMIGGGVGYQFSNLLRMDATASHFIETAFSGSSGRNVTNCGTATGVCDYSETSNVEVTSYLLNAYAELGSVYQFTPYIGAGVGVANVSWDTMTSIETCLSGDCTGSDGSAVHTGNSSWRVAYALHAGTAVNISDKMKLDLGYTFSHIEGGQMFNFEAGNAQSGEQGYDDGIKSHTIRAGLRYEIW